LPLFEEFGQFERAAAVHVDVEEQLAAEIEHGRFKLLTEVDEFVVVEEVEVDAEVGEGAHLTQVPVAQLDLQHELSHVGRDLEELLLVHTQLALGAEPREQTRHVHVVLPQLVVQDALLPVEPAHPFRLRKVETPQIHILLPVDLLHFVIDVLHHVLLEVVVVQNQLQFGEFRKRVSLYESTENIQFLVTRVEHLSDEMNQNFVELLEVDLGGVVGHGVEQIVDNLLFGVLFEQKTFVVAELAINVGVLEEVVDACVLAFDVHKVLVVVVKSEYLFGDGLVERAPLVKHKLHLVRVDVRKVE